MSSSLLGQQVRALLDEAVAVYRGTAFEAPLRAVSDQFDEPLRVAIAGRVKAGKSTLLNALVGEQVAATDAGECTRIVTWYWNGVTYRAWAIPKEGEPQQLPFHRTDTSTVIDLAGWAPEQLVRLTVEIPSSRLEKMTLIDTPGIAALSTDVSHRTVEFLTGEQEAGQGADAVLYLMRHLHTSDMNFLEAFHDLEFRDTVPVNAIGVLSRADEIGAGRTDAIDLARDIAAQYRRDRRVRNLVQTVVPVAGLLAQAGTTLRQREFAALATLAQAPVEEQTELLLSVDRFVNGQTSVAIGPQVRSELLDRFGLFGVKLAIGLLRHGVATTGPSLARLLVERSGLVELRSVLLGQFAARRDVLKARSALRVVEAAVASDPRRGADGLRLRTEQITASTHDFAELKLLNDLRTGTVEVDEDVRETMERLLGASGGSVRERLGLTREAGVDEVRDALLEQLERWQRLSEDPLAGQAVRRAATVLRRTCEGMFLDAELSAQPV